ncbi:MAG: hypothetical protein AAF092_04885 [Pseudomonadota bacterium]
MRKILCAAAMSAAVTLPAAGPVSAETAEENDFWVIWERTLPGLPDCDGQTCDEAFYFGHLIEGMAPGEAQQFFAGLGAFVETPGAANIRMPRNPMCLGPQPATLPDATQLELAQRLDTLRGLPAVHVDLRGVRGPQSFRGSFGETAQAFLEEVFTKHGIAILTKEEAAATQGNATLTMRYSSEVFGCRPWSVSMSMSQRVLLARDPTLMLQTSTWSSSARQNEADADFMEEHAMEQVILAFAQAWSEANGKAVDTAQSN